jgi:uncharacterized UPF0160 family protein
MAAYAAPAGAADLAPGRALAAGEHPLQAPLAATSVVSSLDSAEAYGAAICTHSGGFHCDEALAIGMLKLLPRFQESVVVRSRSSEVHDACAIVVDVGGVHDHARKRYDHHQRSFNADSEDVTLGVGGFKTKLSACGLVYKYYGREIVGAVRAACGAPEESPELADKIWKRVYAGFVEHVDGIDNGIKAFSGGKANYSVSTTLSSRVGALNPEWNEPSSNDVRNAQFQKAMMLTQREFIAKVEDLYKSWLPARQIVERAVLANLEAHTKGKRAAPDAAAAADARILVLDQYCPWIDHMFDLEHEHGIKGRFMYCIFPDSSGGARVRAVPDAPSSFGNRKPLPEPWRGVRDADLASLIGIEGSIFVHNSGFIGGNKTQEGALAMARVAVNFGSEEK